jgi:hypothetical protein
MVSLPRTCSHCGAKMLHYERCHCPGTTLDWVASERRALTERMSRLDHIESQAKKKKLNAVEQEADQ